MHFSLLVIADGTKTLEEIMRPFDYDLAYDNGLYENAKWDCYVVGGRFFGYLDAKIGGHGERIKINFENGMHESIRPYNTGKFDIARVKDIQTLNPYWFHDMLTPDGVWHQSEFYDPERISGRFFIENTWFHDGLLERLQEHYSDCLAIVVDYHSRINMHIFKRRFNMSRINFEHDFKPTSTQEILTFEYSSYKDYEKTIELLDRLPVRYMLHRPGRGLSSDTGLFVDVIVPKKN